MGQGFKGWGGEEKSIGRMCTERMKTHRCAARPRFTLSLGQEHASDDQDFQSGHKVQAIEDEAQVYRSVLKRVGLMEHAGGEVGDAEAHHQERQEDQNAAEHDFGALVSPELHPTQCPASQGRLLHQMEIQMVDTEQHCDLSQIPEEVADELRQEQTLLDPVVRETVRVVKDRPHEGHNGEGHGEPVPPASESLRDGRPALVAADGDRCPGGPEDAAEQPDAGADDVWVGHVVGIAP